MTIKQKQNLLQFLGLYDGEIDGIWGPKSKKGMETARERYGGSDEDALRMAVAAWKEDADTQESFWNEITYFARQEFCCTCGRRGCDGFPAEPRERLVRNADAARKYFGRPAVVSSGVRCRLRNAELPGSAKNSLHLSGRAMDFAIPGVSAGQLLEYVRQLPEVHEAYAIDQNYVHMGVQKQ